MIEGEERTIKQVCKRRTCEVCGEPATGRLGFLLPNPRHNPASKGFGGDDISWCSDDSTFVCAAHEEDRYKLARERGMEWASLMKFERFQHLFFYWETVKDQ